MDDQSIAELSAQAGCDGVENIVYKHLGMLDKEMLEEKFYHLAHHPCRDPQDSYARTGTKVYETSHS